MMSSKHTAGYPPEFRAEAIRLARTSGKPTTQLARDLGMAVWNRRPRPGLIHHSDTPITVASIPPRRSLTGAGRWASSVPWAQPEMVMIMSWPRASLPPWSVSCWIDGPSGPMTRRAVRSLRSSKASTIVSDGTRLWGISAHRTLRGGGFLLHRLSPNPGLSTKPAQLQRQAAPISSSGGVQGGAPEA
jgi:hypothetical protein